MADAIEKFVVTLAERIDELQDAERVGDMPRLATGIGELSAQAEQLGYGVLVVAAAELEHACAAHDAVEARKHLVDVTEVATRIRQGHRGSV